MSDIDPHPPTRQCNCPKCLASFDETALDPENVESVKACLSDDAAMLRDAHPEAANNMDAAATLIDRLYERLARPAELQVEDFLPEAERGALDKIYQAMARKLYAKYLEGTSGFDTASARYLSQLLRRHVDKGDPVDVANFCAFLLFNGQRIESAQPSSGSIGAHSFSPPTPAPPRPVEHECPECSCHFLGDKVTAPGVTRLVNTAAPNVLDLLERQPPKGWGFYLSPAAPHEILISRPNGDGYRVTPESDPLLFELAWAMLPPAMPLDTY